MNFCIASFISIFTIFTTPNLTSPYFEGKISLLKVTPYDTTRINLYIKGDEVRVDIFDCENKLLHSTLVDLKSKEVIMLSQKQHDTNGTGR